jgi:hypothetical protein
MDGSVSTDGVLVQESSSEKSFNVNRISGINSIGTNSDGGSANVITLEGAHTYTILENDTLVYEYKTGPYEGQELDKQFI